MRKLLQLGLFLMCVVAVRAQSTVITATITDTDGQTWNNGTVTASFLPGPVGRYSWPGGPIPPMVSANLDGTGTFTMTLPDNSTITPVGSLWNFSICPNASAPCVVKQMAVSGPTLNLSSQLSSVATGPRFPASPSAYGYLDIEVFPIPQQGGVYWNVTTKFQRIWTGTQWQNQGGGGGSCPEGTCVVNSPTTTQTVVQPTGTTLQSNSLNNTLNASQFGTGSNGIETVYANNSLCIPQGNGIVDGCKIDVPPLYTLSDSPQGWNWQGNDYGGTTSATLMAPGASAFDYRNGTQSDYFGDPINPLGGETALSLATQFTQNLGQRNYLAGSAYSQIGLQLQTNTYNGGWDFQYYPSSLFTQYVGQNYSFGIDNVKDDWTDGISFGMQEIMNHHGLGDAYLKWARLYCDGGILAGNSEGCGIADLNASENPSLYAGTVSAVSATSLTVNCNQDCSAPGQDRLWTDSGSSHAIQGTVATGDVGPQTTGTSSNSAVMPPQMEDTAASYPVSTIFQLCNPNANNGVGGASGCASGSQPTGIIPPVPLTITITAGSVTSNVGTFTGTNSLVAGQHVIVYKFTGSGAPLNNEAGTIDSAGLSGSGFEVDFTNSVPNIAATGTGISTQSPTGFSPPLSITLNVVAPYSGTGGDTNGLPSGFCTTTGSGVTLQSSNSGAACYLPASGYLYLTDGLEYESDAYTYNSTAQTVTITGMMFPHFNGVVASWGGIAGWALQDDANLVNNSTGLGVTGTIAPTYAIAGAITATDLYYIPQRTNEQYGSPVMGLATPSNGNQGFGRQLYFSSAMSGFSISGGVVTFSLANPPQVNGDLHAYNGLIPNISVPSNTTYSCTTCAITWLYDSTFTYTPAAPSGTVPTSGTATYNNASYSIYPAARVLSAFDTATNKVDGVLSIYPITLANDPITVGDTGWQAHYQQIQMGGQHVSVTQFQPNQFITSEVNNINYAGYITGDGFDVDNTNNSNFYLGYGGNWALPKSGLGLLGVWQDSIYANAPDQDFANIQAKPGIGVSSAYSNFNVFKYPSLSTQGPVPGQNGQDCLNYDPYFGASTRSAGLSSGMLAITNCNPIATVTETGNRAYYFSNFAAGHLYAAQLVDSPLVTTREETVNPISDPIVYANPVTTGSTATTYYVLAVTPGNDQTTVTTAVVTNGASTPNNLVCMPPQAGYATYVVMRGSTSTSIITGLSATVGNGATYGQPANYSCVLDNNITPSSYTYLGTNTTGRVTTPNLTVTNIFGPATAPTGSCSVNGNFVLSQDGAITRCLSGTWTAFSSGGGSTVGTAGQIQMVGSTAGSHAASHMTDNGTQITSTEGINVTGSGLPSQVSMTYSGTPLTVGSSTTAVVGVNASGQGVMSEAGGTAARICDATNGVCLTSLPTATAAGQGIYATGAGATYQAANISRVPVEFYGATAYLTEAAAEAGPDDTAHFQSAVSAGVGLATCQSGLWYHVEGPVNFSSNEGLVGTSNQTYGGLCNLVSNSATANILSAVGTSSAYLSGVTWANLSIHRSVTPTGTAAAIYSSFNGGTIAQNILAYDSIYDFYRHASPSFGIGHWSYLQAGWLLGESSGTYYGFYDDSADGNAENSIVSNHDAVACSNLTGSAVSYGQILTGSAVNDNDTWDFNTAGCSYGQVVNYTGGGGAFATNDIHFYNSTNDGMGVSCFKISNTSLATDGFVEINGGHCNASVSGSALVDIESSYGVNIHGLNINQHNGFGASHAIYAASSSGLAITGNTITNFGTTNTSYTPVEWTGVTHSALTGNTVYAYSANAGNIFWLTGNSTYNTITGNNLSGYSTAGYGIGIDAGSNYNVDTPNSIDTTNITSGQAIGDAGTGNGIQAPLFVQGNTASGTLLSTVNNQSSGADNGINQFDPHLPANQYIEMHQWAGISSGQSLGNGGSIGYNWIGAANTCNGEFIATYNSSSGIIEAYNNGDVGVNMVGTCPTNALTIAGDTGSESYKVTGTTFTASGCSTTSLTGGATAGSFVSGTTGTCTPTITMGSSQTATHGWACFANDLTTPADVIHQTATTTTTATFSGTTASGDTLNFACTGY